MKRKLMSGKSLRSNDRATFFMKGKARRVRGSRPGFWGWVALWFGSAIAPLGSGCARLWQGSLRPRDRWRAYCAWGCAAFWFVCAIAPVFAQEVPTVESRAPVVLDGRVLFEVGASGNFSAAERAELVNAALLAEANTPGDIDLVVTEEERLTAIRTREGDRPLIAIGDRDVVPGVKQAWQAEIWRQRLETALERSKRERTPAYLRRAILIVIAMVAGAIALYWGLCRVQSDLLTQIETHMGTPTSPLYSWAEPAKSGWRLVTLALQASVWLLLGYWASDIFPQARSWRYQFVRLLNSPAIAIGDSEYSLLQVVLLAVLSIGLWFGAIAAGGVLRAYILRRTRLPAGTQEVLTVTVRYLLIFLGAIALLPLWGLDLSSLALVASVLGVGIGFGVQNIANNFISGLIIAFERPIQVGNLVEVGGLRGIVQRIGTRHAEIQTLDGVTIIVPNSRFLEQEVVNWSHSNPVSRLHLPVGVEYGSNVERVKCALLAAAKGHPEVLLRPRPQVWFLEFGDSALQFELLVWTSDPKEQPRIKSELNYRIEASLRRYSIQVPFPQRDLHLRSPRWLETAVVAWLRERAPDLLDRIESEETSAAPPPESPEAIFPEEIDAAEEQPLDLEALVAAMRGKNGVSITSRRYRFNLYHACFIGSEAVDWLVEYLGCTREKAVEVGQILRDRGILHHVLDEHSFEDKHLFYRFYSDEQVLREQGLV